MEDRPAFVAYFRVSTERPGRSGLGLEAQATAVADHVRRTGGRVVGQFTEIESGRKVARPQLAAALALAKLHRATLVVAKLDRLARNVAFVATLMESGVEFVACDFPQSNRLTVHILAAVAEHEREMISARTKAALAAAKAQGVKLGGFRGRSGTPEECRRASEAKRAKAYERAEELAPLMATLDPVGERTARWMARQLTKAGIPAPAGGKAWTHSTVLRMKARLASTAGGLCGDGPQADQNPYNRQRQL